MTMSMTPTLRLGRVAGIGVPAHPTWLPVVAPVVRTLASRGCRGHHTDRPEHVEPA